MLKYICKKLVFLVVLLLLISIVVFVAIRLVPGDPVVAMLGSEVAGMSEEYLEYERERLGLNDPMYVQYFNYMKDLFRGDFGVSIRTDQPVLEIILDRYPVTIKIALLSIGLATLFGVILGIISAVKHNSVLDYIISTTSMLSISTPSFFLALVLLLVFALKLKVLPSMGLSSSLHYVLPVVTISVMELGYVARTTRSSMLDVITQDYIRTARAKGVPERIVFYVQALKNALIPIVTTTGLKFGSLLAGSSIVETVFSIQGLGSLVVESISYRDYPCVQGAVLMIAATFVVVNTVVDILYAQIDPRIRYS